MSWQAIETAPRIEGAYYLGYDKQTAADHGREDAGICLISWCESWVDEDGEYWGGDWEVQPFSEGLDCVVSGHNVTHWMPLPMSPTLQEAASELDDTAYRFNLENLALQERIKELEKPCVVCGCRWEKVTS